MNPAIQSQQAEPRPPLTDHKDRMSKPAKYTRRVFYGLVCGFVLVWFVWSLGAIYYLDPLPKWLTSILATAVGTCAVILYRRCRRKRIWLLQITGIIVVVYLITWLQQPSNDRNWAGDNARLAQIQIDGDNVIISNFRNVVYRSETDFDVRYEQFSFFLSEIDEVWFVVQRFTALEGIAHNFLTFSLDCAEGKRYFSVSVEIRREQGEVFSPVKGLFRQYELIYVIADERDEIGVRTVMRPNDRVYMYPVNANPWQVQDLFLGIAERVESLSRNPEFYHSISNNCTNNIAIHTSELTPRPINWLDPRIVAPGFADRVGFERELIGRSKESFAELQQRCRIDEVARNAGITPTFSSDIRSRLSP